MKRIILLLFIILVKGVLVGQTDTVLYENRFAEANSSFRAGDITKALEIYKQLNSRDTNNSDVLVGLGRCYIRLEQYSVAKTMLQRAVILSSRDASPYSDLAFIAIVEGKLDTAIYYYQKMLAIDETNAEAYAGIGKMNYWKDKMKTALQYYEKALKIDPENKEYINKRDLIKRELGYTISFTGMFITEKEENYNIAAVIQRYGLEKRINDYISFSLNTLWDYSVRNNIYESDVRRWFDNSWLKVNFLFKEQKISIFAGASGIENKMTSYGVSWTGAFNIKKVQIRNYLTAAYDYFYYWNKVGHDYYQNTLRVSYKRFSVGATYRYAVVRNNIVWDLEEKTDNPNSRALADIQYMVLKNPKLVIGLQYAYINYKYASPLYYSPINRHLIGATVSNYFNYKKFYTYEEFIYSYDLNGFSQTSASLEAGFDFGKFSFGVSGNYFYNPYYRNIAVQLSLKMIL